MIAVIADDFTGAAELAGISLRYGLTVTVCLHDEITTDTDVLIISTDSRSLKKKEALKVTANAVRKAVELKPDLIYKKIDSVLRGYVIDELKVQMELCGLQRAFIMPANPSLGRTIIAGKYFVDGKQVNETGFVADPEFPVVNSSVKKILNDDSVKVLKHTEFLPANGTAVGEAKDENDINEWARKLDAGWVLAGAGDFYNALLSRRYKQQMAHGVHLLKPHLYVSGTSFRERKEFIKEIAKELNCVSYMEGEVDRAWIDKTAAMIKKNEKAVIAITESATSALSLRTVMAKAVREILQRKTVKELFIEGGSTAAAILRELDIKKLSPVDELQRGVVRMKVNDLFITVKPGSYKVPELIRELYLSE
ncbi:MAG TPA: four-carbon acid sugar kinase family protein [Chitinophagaceae bacterium]